MVFVLRRFIPLYIIMSSYYKSSSIRGLALLVQIILLLTSILSAGISIIRWCLPISRLAAHYGTSEGIALCWTCMIVNADLLIWLWAPRSTFIIDLLFINLIRTKVTSRCPYLWWTLASVVIGIVSRTIVFIVTYYQNWARAAFYLAFALLSHRLDIASMPVITHLASIKCKQALIESLIL